MSEAADPARALDEAWRLLDSEPEALAPKRRLSRLLREHPQLASSVRRGHLARLLADPDLDPAPLAAAGWTLLLREAAPPWRPEAIEGDDLALRLLEEAYVPVAEAEAALTALRRDLLLSGRWDRHRRLAYALVRQARHNGGAWWFGEDERERLAAAGGFASAYLPPRPLVPGTRPGAGVAAEVAGQYRAWPYPPWTRIDAPDPTTLPDALRPFDPDGPPLPAEARVLVAGCGTGREPAILARRFPDARITAIDISETSLAYAAERCRGLGIAFRRLDLHRAAELGEFDFISSSGVLHHLEDPEAGWAALTAALRPGGAMRLMLYSRLARLRVRAARSRIADLVDRPVTDDLLREARRRLLAEAPHLLGRSLDFYTLGGVHDLLLHRHEDPFDVPRIRRGIERLGLSLIAFVLPTAAHRARYRREHPGDPLFRDYEAWAALEKSEPFLFAAMYEFWCRKPL